MKQYLLSFFVESWREDHSDNHQTYQHRYQHNHRELGCECDACGDSQECRAFCSARLKILSQSKKEDQVDQHRRHVRVNNPTMRQHSRLEHVQTNRNESDSATKQVTSKAEDHDAE